MGRQWGLCEICEDVTRQVLWGLGSEENDWGLCAGDEGTVLEGPSSKYNDSGSMVMSGNRGKPAELKVATNATNNNCRTENGLEFTD
jgi:hypothetical protein